MKKQEKVREFQKVEYKDLLYYWAVCDSGRVYLGKSHKENPEKIKWELIKNPIYIKK